MTLEEQMESYVSECAEKVKEMAEKEDIPPTLLALRIYNKLNAQALGNYGSKKEETPEA